MTLNYCSKGVDKGTQVTPSVRDCGVLYNIMTWLSLRCLARNMAFRTETPLDKMQKLLYEISCSGRISNLKTFLWYLQVRHKYRLGLPPHCIMGLHDQWEFPPFFQPQWQSHYTALTACLPLAWLGLLKGTVKESISLMISNTFSLRIWWHNSKCTARSCKL